ncbi:hypothetical protein PoB_004063200 [Plakobranchus ocellatus]|uniref:Uncharacterized protein n=1 Tax=Plakobranchus ocellatus TaxID=259542 RepID=A0AAV4B4J8_9GAST|nr:hypothetical protein PoB_004063200 [Plakobranchus ocellatus]
MSVTKGTEKPQRNMAGHTYDVEQVGHMIVRCFVARPGIECLRPGVSGQLDKALGSENHLGNHQVEQKHRATENKNAQTPHTVFSLSSLQRSNAFQHD